MEILQEIVTFLISDTGWYQEEICYRTVMGSRLCNSGREQVYFCFTHSKKSKARAKRDQGSSVKVDS